MDEQDLQAHRKAIEIAKARIMEEAAAKAAELDREWAELERLATKFNVPLGAPNIPPVPVEALIAPANLTLSQLIAAYRSDPNSPYHKVQFRTRENYESNMKRLDRELGPIKIADLDDDRIQQLRVAWSAGGHFAIMDSLTGMLRILGAYGASALKSRECRALKAITADYNTRTSKPRTERLTETQARNIIEKAHEMGQPSIALAQAIQFDCRLRQTVVIGIWVPIGEKGPATDITADGMKWLPGLRWSSIDRIENVLRHPKGEVDLRKAELVNQELGRQDRIVHAPADPLIVYERTGLPYRTYQFRRNWRLVANASGVPPSVKNMDSHIAAGGEDDTDIEEELAGQN